jgi:hypothetical protein
MDVSFSWNFVGRRDHSAQNWEVVGAAASPAAVVVEVVRKHSGAGEHLDVDLESFRRCSVRASP